MNAYRTNVVGMSLEAGYLLGGVVVVDTKLEIVGTADYPVLARDEAASADRDVGELEGLDNCLRSLSALHMVDRAGVLTCVS